MIDAHRMKLVVMVQRPTLIRQFALAFNQSRPENPTPQTSQRESPKPPELAASRNHVRLGISINYCWVGVAHELLCASHGVVAFAAELICLGIKGRLSYIKVPRMGGIPVLCLTRRSRGET